MTRKRIPILIVLLMLGLSALLSAQEADAFHFKILNQDLLLQKNQAVNIEIEISVDPGYYLYQDMLAIRPEPSSGLEFGKAIFPPAHKKYDKILEQEKMIYTGTNVFRLPVTLADQAPETGKVTINIDFQGCSSQVCFLPTTLTLVKDYSIGAGAASEAGTIRKDEPISPTSTEVKAPGESPSSEPLSSNESDQNAISRNLSQKNYFFAFLALFIFGILTSFTPCVYPIIPITISIFGARGAESKLKGFILSLIYVQGIAVTYSVLGIVAAKTGAIFGQYMSNPIVIGIIAVVFILLGLFMAGFFYFNVPASLQTKVSTVGGKGYIGAFTMGMVSGIIAAPCTGPALASVLAWVATTQDAVLGFLLLYTYAIGLGLLFIILGTFSTLISKLPKSGTWMDVVKGIFAVVMFTVALYFLMNVVPFLSLDFMSRSNLFIAGTAMILLGLCMKGLMVDINGASWRDLLRKVVTLILLSIGAFFLIVGIIRVQSPDVPQSSTSHAVEAGFWRTDVTTALADARKEDRPVIIDFYADWCAACKELDKFTYTDPRVQAQLQRFVRIKVDMTRNTPENEVWKDKYKIVGLPLVVFHDPSGKLLDSPRITGFVGPDEFLKILKTVP